MTLLFPDGRTYDLSCVPKASLPLATACLAVLKEVMD